jgi:hypothetical protein
VKIVQSTSTKAFFLAMVISKPCGKLKPRNNRVLVYKPPQNGHLTWSHEAGVLGTTLQFFASQIGNELIKDWQVQDLMGNHRGQQEMTLFVWYVEKLETCCDVDRALWDVRFFHSKHSPHSGETWHGSAGVHVCYENAKKERFFQLKLDVTQVSSWLQIHRATAI